MLSFAISMVFTFPNTYQIFILKTATTLHYSFLKQIIKYKSNMSKLLFNFYNNLFYNWKFVFICNCRKEINNTDLSLSGCSCQHFDETIALPLLAFTTNQNKAYCRVVCFVEIGWFFLLIIKSRIRATNE